jgi:hypothetical protein
MQARTIGVVRSALNNEPVVILGKVGANGKVSGEASRVLGMAVVPLATMEHILQPTFADIPGGHMGGKYIESIKDHIDAVCDDACEHKRTRKCYAQFNAQSTTEAVKMIRDAGPVTLSPSGDMSSGATIQRNIISIINANDLGPGDRVRWMIVGSTGALPMYASQRVINTCLRRGLTPLAYVENWRDRPDLRASHMASCFTLDDVREAEFHGWRAFYSPAAETLGNVVPDGFTMCPSSKYRANTGRALVGCADCGLCNGATTDDNRKHILNIRHGNGDASRVAGLVRRGELDRIITNKHGRTVGAYTK